VKRLRPILWVPLVGFVIFLIVFSIGLNQPEEKAIPSALVGQPMPAFALAPAMAGRPGLSSAELRQGRPRLINIFASWCIPCRQEAPQLEELSRRGIPIDGIAVRDRPEDLARFLASYGDPFRSIGADIDRRVQLNLGSAGVPETFIIDGRGIIRHQHIGPINPADMPAILAAWQEASR
jgi:cytochrome c biogenesis protein CcmG/thiol:disulfide interchange protein DsbE